MADTGITQLQIVDTVTGSGAEARPGRVVRVHYTGWLYDATKPDKRGKSSTARRTAASRSTSRSAAGR